jgi:hypothetical protein
MSHAHIIEKFGGTRAMARKIGRTPSTVQSWKDRGFIPARLHADILAVAQQSGVDLTPADFVSGPAPEEAA